MQPCYARISSLRPSTIERRQSQGFYEEPALNPHDDVRINDIDLVTSEQPQPKAIPRDRATNNTMRIVVFVINTNEEFEERIVEYKKCCICFEAKELEDIIGDYDCKCEEASVCNACFQMHYDTSNGSLRCPLCGCVVSKYPVNYIE